MERHQGITSLDDPRVREYRALSDPSALQRAGLFVAEGRWVVERLLARPQFTIRSVLVTPTAARALESAAGTAWSRARVLVVEQRLMDEIVGFNIHRGCLALAERRQVATLTPHVLERAARVVVLEGVNNPDNVGGIFRSAAAFGVDLVVLGPACGDPLYRKAIRTSMAATLDVPYVSAGTWPAALTLIRDAGMRLLAMTPEGAVPLTSVPADDRLALLFGTESSGLSDEALARCDAAVRIEMTDRVDSLNVTVAASIAMHHVFPR